MSPVTRWVFLRHGESTANASRVLSGWTDVPLTDRGRAQATEAGQQLAELDAAHGGGLFTRVLSSDLQRARNTARLAVEAWAARSGQPTLVVRAEAALRERQLGEFSGRKLDDLRATGEADQLLTWNVCPPGGESLALLMARVLPALAAHDTGEPTLVVAHGGVIRGLLAVLDRQDRAVAARNKIPNAVPIRRDVETGALARMKAG